jgi:probable phosphoglycerate mutase
MGGYLSLVTTILLARHGETDWNREGRFQGWADPPLNEAGREQARALAERLRDTPFDAVYSSDLRRAHETAAIVAAPHGVPVVSDPDLREIDVGSWSGLTRTEIEERFPGAEHHDGESRTEHLARVLAAVERIARTHHGQRILIVSHGGSLRTLRRHCIGEPVHPIENCGVYELHFRDDRFVAPAS